MSFSWANKLAKSALLSAKKGIDSVLDIDEEDSLGEAEGNNENFDEEEELNTFNEEKVLIF